MKFSIIFITLSILFACVVASSLSSPKKPSVLTSQGHTCSFPFSYKGQVYNECTKEDSYRKWCSLKKGKYEDNNAYDGCLEPSNKVIYTMKGNKCVFPFRVNGTIHWDCLISGHHRRPWCAVDDGDFDTYKKSDFCVEHHKVKTTSGHSCIFPFIYKGKSHSECVVESNGTSWCAIEHQNFDIHGTKDTCIVVNHDSMPTESGKTCALPFIYNGKSHDDCVKGVNDKYWCATESKNFDENGTWDFCKFNKTTLTVNGSPCRFPFIYKNIPRNECMKHGEKLWCAIKHSNYDKYREWDYCANENADGMRK